MGSFISGCNMSPTNPRIYFIVASLRTNTISLYEHLGPPLGALPTKSLIFEDSRKVFTGSNNFIKNWVQYGALPKNPQNYHISSVIRTDSDTNIGNTASYITGTFRSAVFKSTGDIRRYAGSSVKHGGYPTSWCTHQ